VQLLASSPKPCRCLESVLMGDLGVEMGRYGDV